MWRKRWRERVFRRWHDISGGSLRSTLVTHRQTWQVGTCLSGCKKMPQRGKMRRLLPWAQPGPRRRHFARILLGRTPAGPITTFVTRARSQGDRHGANQLAWRHPALTRHLNGERGLPDKVGELVLSSEIRVSPISAADILETTRWRRTWREDIRSALSHRVRVLREGRQRVCEKSSEPSPVPRTCVWKSVSRMSTWTPFSRHFKCMSRQSRMYLTEAWTVGEGCVLHGGLRDRVRSNQARRQKLRPGGKSRTNSQRKCGVSQSNVLLHIIQ